MKTLTEEKRLIELVGGPLCGNAIEIDDNISIGLFEIEYYGGAAIYQIRVDDITKADYISG